METEFGQPAGQQRPAMGRIDVFGITHQGHVRKENADHFFIGSFHRTLRIHGTSFPADDIGPQETDSRGFLLLVADGVGSLHASAEGSKHALAVVTSHLLHASEICSNMALANREAAIAELKAAVGRAHEALHEDAERDGTGTAATTLTMYAAFWPMGFIVQVGDSRMYRLRGETFERLTTDQTMAQMMLEAGVMTTKEAEGSHLKHVLWSAVGAQEAVPEVLVTDLDLRDRSLLCSDGLTKHVSDDEIKDYLSRDMSSEEMCRALLNLALERGGTDNVTVVSGRVRKS
jgi:protein phosphatase